MHHTRTFAHNGVDHTHNASLNSQFVNRFRRRRRLRSRLRGRSCILQLVVVSVVDVAVVVHHVHH